MQSCIILLRSNLKLEINEFKNKEKIFVHRTTKQNIQEIYIIKQDIRIYVPYSLPNGWTDWAKNFCGHSWVAEGCYTLKKCEFCFFFKNYFFKFFFLRATPGPSASIL